MRLGLAVLFVVCLSAAAMAGTACRDARGDADTLVDQCEQVSPATHPPCNALNPCDLIVSEIRRGCGMLDAADRPKFCRVYLD